MLCKILQEYVRYNEVSQSLVLKLVFRNSLNRSFSLGNSRIRAYARLRAVSLSVQLRERTSKRALKSPVALKRDARVEPLV